MSDDLFDEGSWADLAALPPDSSLGVGTATVRGRPLAVAAFRFENHAGTVGLREADGFIALVRHAIAERLPLVALVRSGGIRMQEGAEPFTRVADIVRSLSDLRAAGLPFVAHLGHPATGGALVGVASMAQIRWAEPGALVTVVGPRAGGRDMRAEQVLALGQLDELVPLQDVPDALARLLTSVSHATSGSPGDASASCAADPPPSERADDHDAAPVVGWGAVRAARDERRELLRSVVDRSSERTSIRGDRVSADDDSVFAGICRLGGRGVVLVAGSLRPDRKILVAGIRKATRAFALAGELGLPIVTLVDVAGPDAATDIEWTGLPGAVAGCLDALHRAPVGSVGVMLGSGSGAAALALLGTATVLGVESSWLAPLSPEQAAAILHGDVAEAAAKAADLQGPSATELYSAGWVDEVVADDAAAVVDAIARRLAG